MAAVAFADNADGDFTGTTAKSANVPASQPYSLDVDLYVVRQSAGNIVKSVSWSATANTCGVGAAGAPSPSSFTLPDSWETSTGFGTKSKDLADPKASSATIAGTAGAAGGSCSVTYTGTPTENFSGNGIPPGNRTVTFTINFVAAANSAPEITKAEFDPATVSCGTDNATLKVEWTDLDENDTHTVSVLWGDGSALEPFGVQTSPFQASHTYAAAGNYTATVTVSDGTDSDDDTASLTVLFNTSGILQPINADGTSLFRINQTIPVKAVFTDCDGSLPTNNPTVHLTRISNGVNGEVEVDPLLSSSTADNGNWMRYSTEGEQHISNLSTKKSQFNSGNDLSQGTYRLTIKIDVITQFSVEFALRK